MKYLLDPSVFALDANATKREFNIFVNRILLWDKWFNDHPDDVYILSDTSSRLFEMGVFPVYDVFEALANKHDIRHVQPSNVNQIINRLLQRANEIDRYKGCRVDGDMALEEMLANGTKAGRDMQQLLWPLYCRCRMSGERMNTFIVIGKDFDRNVTLDVTYKTLAECKGELVEKEQHDHVELICVPSLPQFFRTSGVARDILVRSDEIDDLYLAVRVAVYQNGELEKVADAYSKYPFTIQRTFHRDYRNNHYLSKPGFLTSYIEAMSHSLLNKSLRHREDFRTGKGGDNPQMRHNAKDGVWLAWRWKVTESVSFQYWRLDAKVRFANIGEHDYFCCSWEEQQS